MRVTRALVSWAQAAGLLGTGYVIWIYSLGPRLNANSLSHLLSAALTYALIAWAFAAGITFCILITVTFDDMADIIRASIRSSAVAMWFAPAVILLSARNMAVFTASLILVVNTTRLLIAQWVSPSAVGTTRHVLVPAFAAAIILQGGLVSVLWGYPFLASAFIAGGTAVVTALALLTGAYRSTAKPILPVAFLSILLTFVLAIALMPGSGFGPAGESGSSDSRGRPAAKLVMPPPEATEKAQGRAQQKAPKTWPEAADVPGGDFPGVVLLPELSPQPMLVAPPAPSAASKLRLREMAQPFSVPFTGEYWMFRFPAIRPPARSYSRRGSPLRLSFHTTDGTPLQMEATQSLARPIDPRCCDKLQLAIANADTYPGTVSLQVILSETGTAGSQSLGSAATGPESRAVLDFPIPAAPSIQQFNQIRVIFHRDRVRINKSARIQIERFIVVPRGAPGAIREELIAGESGRLSARFAEP